MTRGHLTAFLLCFTVTFVGITRVDDKKTLNIKSHNKLSLENLTPNNILTRGYFRKENPRNLRPGT